MEYYSSFGQGRESRGDGTPTLRSVLEDEGEYPNATVDAKRIIGTIRRLRRPGRGARLLDVGCGYGFFSREAMDAGFDVVAIELAENERGIASEMTGLAPAACSFEEFECAPESLSAILMSQILEHALDVNAWVAKAHRLLADGGVLAIAVPNFGSAFRMIMQEREPFICPPSHLNFFTSTSLCRLLRKHGFKVEATQWVSRLPRRAFAKRMPTGARRLVPLIDAASSIILRTLDALHLGRIVNVYARKRTSDAAHPVARNTGPLA
jgi:SAM-dependent methyltransferase